ncbi:glycosyltransferase family protein [Pollutibacter soli]|uniref:glycosyltransferase family protein n=1 Tax=Pollutibacter soli TaxID=3034157 RepID=UPI0030136733
MKKKSFLFLVQGEGRGHLTQAITISEMLQQHNHEVCCVVVGMSGKKTLPAFFPAAINSPVVTIPSPGFVTDTENKSVLAGKTVFHNLFRVKDYISSIRKINMLIRFHKPDVVINFYEPLAAIYNLVYREKIRTFSIAHQFVYLHPGFHFPETSRIRKNILKWYTRFVALHSHKILAISMYQLPSSISEQIIVIPPVLRTAIRKMSPGKENFILVYLVNSGYKNQIIEWHKQHPEISIHCFMDCNQLKNDHKGEWIYDETLSFHSLNDRKFMEMMASCNAMATTAGFESVCEAMYLSKPVMMVPVEGQFEQCCNAADAQKNGAGIRADHFDLSKLIQYIPNHNQQSPEYHRWVEQAESIIMQSLQAG